MNENEKFIESFNFDLNYEKKSLLILSNKTNYFNILPIDLIREVIEYVSFRKKGFYYFIQDSSNYPNKSNKYLGTIKSRCGKKALVSYNGWNDSFDEQVNISQISFLQKNQYPLYVIGDLLDILDKKTSLWFLGGVLDIKFINNQQFLTIIYLRGGEYKEIIIVKDIPVYYKYIATKYMHTYKYGTTKHGHVYKRNLWGARRKLKRFIKTFKSKGSYNSYKIIYI